LFFLAASVSEITERLVYLIGLIHMVLCANGRFLSRPTSHHACRPCCAYLEPNTLTRITCHAIIHVKSRDNDILGV